MQSTLVTSSIQILKQVILSLEEAKIRPFINVSHTFLHASNFNEKGAGTNNLQYKKSHTHSFRIELATVISHTFAIDATLLQSAVKLGWTHRQSLGKRSQESRFASIGQSDFTTQKTSDKYRNNFSSAIALTTQFENGLYIMGDVS